MNTNTRTHVVDRLYRLSNVVKFLGWSLLGIFIFFVPITFSGNKTIPLDHLVTNIMVRVPSFAPIFTFVIIMIGSILPFYEKSWNKDKATFVLSILKLLAIIPGSMVIFNFGPEWLMREDMLPFLFRRVVMPVALIVPLGSLFLTFITGYGLLEFFGVLMKPIMRPVWKVPGVAAVNVVASFVGSFSVGIFMTNRLFREGKYTVKEAAIITTGFSTVSATFMVIIAKTLDLMFMWNAFFWSALIITFVVSAITIRLHPLKSMEDTYITGAEANQLEFNEKLFLNAIREAFKTVEGSNSILKNMMINLKDGLEMCLRLIPGIVSIGLISLILVKTTNFFDVIGYIYYPLTTLLKLSEPMLIAKISAIAGAEVFIPSVIVAAEEVGLATRFIAGVVSISSILFFSGSIPCILATDIDLSIKDILLILVQRTALTIILVTPVAMILF
ncbi:nucleoside recognition domain protein [Alkaliphilus metalliredigens QYMF]|uniref:Nucleoside recognition domain protein n=1 Tax=Alkaliphilus metalliredigens (strain QYMF) TaxID=293826 RepID=A6TLB4_ALKMQ|nr:YjiH family protein [Alkaliphilus metalliredigens]ABR46982.1 nucleoside recognition domain protein [Alkaliphilus metalliredigens QYMF]